MKEKSTSVPMPRWYQDLSIPQVKLNPLDSIKFLLDSDGNYLVCNLKNTEMKNLFSLGDNMRADYAERVTGRTQRTLCDIGVTSTFVKITPGQIIKIRRFVDLDPVKFLCEIYRIVTGKYFTDEEYKKVYDCNERIILSAIAFLTLPEAVIELHRRIPMGEAPRLPPKPTPQKIGSRKREPSPYLESPFTRPDWLAYNKELHIWRKQCERTPIPRAILPPLSGHSRSNEVMVSVERERNSERTEKYLQSNQQERTDKGIDNASRIPRIKAKIEDGHENETIDKADERVHKLRGDDVKSGQRPRSNYVSQRVNVTKNATAERRKMPGTVEESERSLRPIVDFQQNKAYGKIDEKGFQKITRQDNREESRSETKSCLSARDTHLIVTGVSINDDLPDYPISHETGGFACVTPENSDESFFAALNLSDIKKTYPRGRENLSKKWQEWLAEMDEEFMSVEKEANKIIKSVEGTMKLLGPEAVCDSCCSCRQTRKANVKYHRTKTPQMVIDSITIDGKGNKYVVGAVAMNSPAPSPSESTADLPDVVASHDNIIKNKIISGVTNEKGETNYYVSGVSKDIEHVPRKILSQSTVSKPVKNVPPCGCAIEKLKNEGLTEVMSDDNIPWTKNDQMCFGEKYRPREIGATSCREYPNDKSCRRNPFKKKIDEEIRSMHRKKENSGKDNYPPEKKNMYSMAAFQPCGDEDGMAICGGRWGAVNIPDEEELARRQIESKLISESPPCGEKPGRAICGGPFGLRHPMPKKPKRDDDEEEDEEEPDAEELEARKKQNREGTKKLAVTKITKRLNRDDRCHTVSNGNGKSDKTPAESANKIKQYHMTKTTRGDKTKKILKENEKDREKEIGSQATIKTLGGSKISEVKKLKNEWNRMKVLANKFVVPPSIFPKDSPRMCKREVEEDCSEANERFLDKQSAKEGGVSYGWRSKSEQALATEKTLVYLANPDEAVETIPVRPGGKPCMCRENRNAKKILLYNVAGTMIQGKGKRDAVNSPVIDGLIYITPTPSVRNSEEYVPEYELYESPYEKCLRERKTDDFKYIEKYLGPKSLMAKQPRRSTGCKCPSMKEKMVNLSRQEAKNNDHQLTMKDSKRDERKWSRACRDERLIDFYARCRDNVPCWLRCVEFSKDGCCIYPKALKVMRPVCECKYERKLLKREEEKKNWLSRQERLKSQKKQPYSHVQALSRPIESETNLIISNVKGMCSQDGSINNLEYCIAGVTQERVMGPAECILGGIGMHSPVTTPEPSKPDIPVAKPHRHWSPTNIQAGVITSENENTLQVQQSTGATWMDKIKDKSEKEVDVLFQKDQVTTNRSIIRKRNVPTGRDMDLGKGPKLHISGKTNEYHKRTKDLEGNKASEKNLEKEETSNVHLTKVTDSNVPREKKIFSNSKNEGVLSKTDLKDLMQIELEKMGGEGFLFAKLPACHQMPQLQYWIMYRKGIAFTPEEKKKFMDRSLKIWKALESQKPKKMKAPVLKLQKGLLKNLNWDKVDVIKREVALNNALFYSKLRKSRVLQARAMWALMEFGKFPGVSFKRAFFTYQASKESDGFVFKPWKPS